MAVLNLLRSLLLAALRAASISTPTAAVGDGLRGGTGWFRGEVLWPLFEPMSQIVEAAAAEMTARIIERLDCSAGGLRKPVRRFAPWCCRGSWR